MIRNAKGGIGFMEAMVSAASVCIVLTCFTAFLATALAEEHSETPEFDWNAAYSVSLANGEYDGSAIAESAEEQAVRGGWNGVAVTCTGPVSSTWEYGNREGDSVRDTVVRSVPSDDGRSVPTVFEAVIWY